jgi:DNA mismatch repair protein MutS2
MISKKTLNSIEYFKIMQSVAQFGTLDSTKSALGNFLPVNCFSEASNLLSKTSEAYKLLYTYSVSSIYYFEDINEEIKRVNAGGTLNMGELLKISSALRCARILRTSIEKINDETITLIPEIASRLYYNHEFEKEITDKIISPDEMSDNASAKLASIRRSIKSINTKIRERLNSYMRGGFGKYLQENVVTIRQDRYVVPVKSEYRSMVKGFIHDQSASGSTVFIEPEQVLELNNELKRATLDETNEINRILAELSSRITFMADALIYNSENISEIDSFYARAEYSFKNKCTYPVLNDKGYINIKKGRHPLISLDKVVPVSITLGNDYNFLLITGPNTGGKTVTLKLTGLISLMAMSGLFIPAEEESSVSVFSNVFCDIGDEQSIENNLSTFSSHITNIIDILNNIDEKSLVLLDELGAGTDPEEGSALALSIIEKLLSKNCFGIITTHYSRLKEFAVVSKKIENASMEFDTKTLSPLYKLNIGIPGSSNAIDIAKTLGLDTEIILNALSHLSTEQVSYENVIKRAEQSRREADELKHELEIIKKSEQDALNAIEEEKNRITVEREKIRNGARAEIKRIVADKLADAEEIIDELKKIIRESELNARSVVRAGELKNRLKNSKYLDYQEEEPFELKPVSIKDLSVNDKVYVKSFGSYATVVNVKLQKGEIEVAVGVVRSKVKINDLFNLIKTKQPVNNVKIFRSSMTNENSVSEINVVGQTSLEAEENVKNFIDKSVMLGLEEIKIIHGVGQGILIKTIREMLRNEKSVESFRRGKYGEGENGVTIVKLK